MMILSQPLPTIGQVRDEHLALMQAWRQINDESERATRAAGLRQSVADAGRGIGDEKERYEAQGIIDYWASSIASLKTESYPPIIELAPYRGENVADVGRNALEVYGDMKDEESRKISRALFECLMARGEVGYIKLPAALRSDLRARIGGSAFDSVVDAYIKCGAIVALAGTSPGDERFELSDVSLIEQWPELGAWIDAKADEVPARAYLERKAQDWAQSQRPSAKLIRDPNEVERLERFRLDPGEIGPYVAASLKAVKRRRWTLPALFGIFATVAAVLLVSIFLAAGYRVQQSADDVLEQALPNSQVDPNDGNGALAPTATAMRGPLAQDDSLKGAIWLGSDEVPQVRAPMARAAPVPVETAQANTQYRVRADTNLRTAMPDADGAYRSAPSKAIVPAGALIVLLEPPLAYERASGTQYWAQVRVVPRVFIQHTGMASDSIEILRQTLSNAGFDVPAAQVLPNANGLREIRYFNEADIHTASLLFDAIAETAGDGAGLLCRSFAGSRVQGHRFTFELWIDTRSSLIARKQCNIATPSGPLK